MWRAEIKYRVMSIGEESEENIIFNGQREATVNDNDSAELDSVLVKSWLSR